MGRKLGGGLCPFWGELGPHLTQCGRAEAYLRAKFHLDPSNRLATIHQRYRQDRQYRTGQTGQRFDSIGRTVLQTVAKNISVQKLLDRIARTAYVDAVYCYRLSRVVCRSVCPSVRHTSEPCKTAEPIEMQFVLGTRVSPGNHVLDGAEIPQ